MPAHFSLACNLDPELPLVVSRLNDQAAGGRRIVEVFGALPDSPVPSARPTSRIPSLSRDAFARQVAAYLAVGVRFNYLLNAPNAPLGDLRYVREYLHFLRDTGVTSLTVGSLELCRFVRDAMGGAFDLTMSITFHVHDEVRLELAERAGVDAVYLEPTRVNRNFTILRQLVRAARTQVRLYANVSCIAACPVAEAHYALFSEQSHKDARSGNDAFFLGCALVKLDPVEWIQMPFIRPEDVDVYLAEGVLHFKLSDRLATTPILERIGGAYLSGDSGDDLFALIERDGAKFRLLGLNSPYSVVGSRLPCTFVDHFRSGDCSGTPRCSTCKGFAAAAVERIHDREPVLPAGVAPYQLLQRARSNAPSRVSGE